MAAAEEEPPARLSELLASGWRLLDEVEAAPGAEEPPSSSPSSPGPVPVQRKVQSGIRLLERAAGAVAELQLFSRGEDLEEVASADLKFLLVPALLASLVLKQRAGAGGQRLEHVRRARASFRRFLEACQDYGLLAPRALPPPEEDEAPPGGGTADQAAQLLSMAANRQAKIERYKQKKEIETRLASLKPFVDSSQADDEQVREFYLLQIKKWISMSLDEIESIDQEIAILSRRDAGLQQGKVHRPSLLDKPPMKPFILTRDAAQAKVFGAGYPGLPTMTVDDWYDQHQKRGVLPDQGVPQRPAGGTEEQEREREEEEEDNEEAVWKAREWDDWKDTHPRGYGNRKNMG